jgi:hypothetical protein
MKSDTHTVPGRVVCFPLFVHHIDGLNFSRVVFGLVRGRAQNLNTEPTPTCNPDPLSTGRVCGYAATGSATGAG